MGGGQAAGGSGLSEAAAGLPGLTDHFRQERRLTNLKIGWPIHKTLYAIGITPKSGEATGKEDNARLRRSGIGTIFG